MGDIHGGVATQNRLGLPAILTPPIFEASVLSIASVAEVMDQL